MNMPKLAKFLLKINYAAAAVLFTLIIALHACQAHANEVKVMVIDAGIGKNDVLKDYVQYDETIDYVPEIDHGTHVAGIVVYGNEARNPNEFLKDPICSEIKIYSCNYYSSPGLFNFSTAGDRMRKCLERAIEQKMDIINISGGGTEFSQPEYNLIKIYTEAGGLVVASAGNEGKELADHPFYPASYGLGHKIPGTVYVDKLDVEHDRFVKVPFKTMVDEFPPLKNIVAVSSVREDFRYVASSNRDPRTVPEKGLDIFSTLNNNNFGYMTGTSQAAPAFLHKTLMSTCKRMGETHDYRISPNSN